MSVSLSPLSLNASMESDTDISGEGRITLEAKDTFPSNLPVSTSYCTAPAWNHESNHAYM